MAVLTVGAMAVLAVLLAGAVAVSSAVEASHRARAAADLAALAAAVAWQTGAAPGEACRRAAEIADANRADLVGCSPEADGSVTTTARVTMRWPVATATEVKARAGPGP
jgi:secretion/DNA translocation related TadE-like protein